LRLQDVAHVTHFAPATHATHDRLDAPALVRLAQKGHREAFRVIIQRCNQRLSGSLGRSCAARRRPPAKPSDSPETPP